MLEFNIVSLFPELIEPYFKDSILKKAILNKLIEVNFYNLRNYATDKHKKVDDTPYGGGAGMLLKADVLYNAVKNIKKSKNTKVIYFSPQGKKLDNKLAKKYIKESNLILICGRYEGVDQRFIDKCVDEEISIGDYVLSGGELAACVFIEVLSRFIPAVLGNIKSWQCDTFENKLLKYPQYTRPYNFKGITVPEVLISGNHEKIKQYREETAKIKTMKKRKDLL